MRPGVTPPRVETRHQSPQGQVPQPIPTWFHLYGKVQVNSPDGILGTHRVARCRSSSELRGSNPNPESESVCDYNFGRMAVASCSSSVSDGGAPAGETATRR